MNQIFFKANGFETKRSQPKLSNVEELIPNYEYDAYGHWVFETSSASLVDKVNNKTLTLQSGAAYTPVYSSVGVTISTAVGNALVSDLSDTSTQSITLAAVVRCSSTALAILLGNLVPSTSTTSSGLSAFSSDGKGYLTVKPVTANSLAGISSLTPPVGHNQTSNFFIAISVDKTTKKGIIYVKQNTSESTNEATYTASSYQTSANKYAVGNSVYTTTNNLANTATFAEAIIFNKALTLVEIQALAGRSKERMDNRGISL